APGVHEIEVGVAVGVSQMLARATRNKTRRAANRTKGAHRGAYSAGDHAHGARVQRFGARGVGLGVGGGRGILHWESSAKLAFVVVRSARESGRVVCTVAAQSCRGGGEMIDAARRGTSQLRLAKERFHCVRARMRGGRTQTG